MTAKVAVLVGSLREGSINRITAKALAGLAEGKLQFDFVEIGDLPLYNDDLWQDGKGPAPVERMKAQVQAADAVLLVTPEYNRAVPGVVGFFSLEMSAEQLAAIRVPRATGRSKRR